jgi:hypothetical protein
MPGPGSRRSAEGASEKPKPGTAERPLGKDIHLPALDSSERCSPVRWASTSPFRCGAIVQAERARNSFEIAAPGVVSGWGAEIATGVPRRQEAQPQEIRQLGSPSVDSPPYSGPQTRTREVANCRPVSFAFQRRYSVLDRSLVMGLCALRNCSSSFSQRILFP